MAADWLNRISIRAHEERDNTSPDRDGANPQPTVGSLWFRQAQVDFESIRPDVTPCWVYFKCQQAVEKALKALIYNKDAGNVTRKESEILRTHDLKHIYKACNINDVLLENVVEQMLEILGDDCYEGTRYPDRTPGETPDSLYRRKPNISTASQLCDKIIQIVKPTFPSPTE